MRIIKFSICVLILNVLVMFNSCVEPYQPITTNLAIYAPLTCLQLKYYSNDGNGGIAHMMEILDFSDTCCYRFLAEVGKTKKILEGHPEYGIIDVQRIAGTSPVYITPVWFVIINDNQDYILSDKNYSIKERIDALQSQTDYVTMWNDDEVHSISAIPPAPPTIKL